jgi:hypothetical protein
MRWIPPITKEHPMPSESEFRTLLENEAAGAAGPRRLDAAAIIRRSKRRRLPQQLAVGGLSTLAVAGIGFAGVTALRALPQGATVMSAGSSADSGTVPERSDPSTAKDAKRAPADRINLCGGALAEVTPNPDGLVLSTAFPASSAAGASAIEGTATLTNTGTRAIRGTTAASPAITLSQDGVVLWHSNGPMIMLAVVVDLAPGQSMSYPASFTPVRCEPADDLASGFRDPLPALPAGSYQVSAAIDLSVEGESGSARNELVTGPVQTVALR